MLVQGSVARLGGSAGDAEGCGAARSSYRPSRCTIGLALAFRDRLSALGRQEGADFEYTELPGAGHASTDIEQQVAAFSRVADYLERAPEATRVRRAGQAGDLLPPGRHGSNCGGKCGCCAAR